MAHLYDKAPPAFAKDPWAWDYTRDRMEDNTGLSYPDWQGKHFAGAAAMYKNVVKKYTASMQAGSVTIPTECVDCGYVHSHYVDDYICTDCRNKIEAAGSYAEAAQTITQPESIDAIREQLYKSLGHDKKDAKIGRSSMAVVTQSSQDTAARHGETAKVSRNYKAMNPEKLARVIGELENDGDAAARAKVTGEDVMDHLEAALRAQQEKS